MTTAMQQLLTGGARLPGFSDEWEKKRFGDICTFLSTANNPRADLEEHGAVGYVHYGNIHAHPLPVLNCASHDLPRIEEGRVGNAARLRDGDLVMVDASEDLEGLGKSVEVIGVGNDDIVAGLHTILCRGGSDHWAAGFKAYLQYIPSFKSTLVRVATGISVYAISKRQLADIVLALPPPDEQRTIAEALSDVDGLIESLESLIAKKRAVKMAAMQQLLTGKTRLPGFSGEWKTKRLEHVTDCLDHVRIPLNETQRINRPGAYPYCGANGVLDYVDDFVIDDDVILIAEDGGYFDEYAYRPIAYRMSGKIWVNNHAHVLKAKLGYSQDFIFYSMAHKNVLPYLASGTRAKLNKSEMNTIEICFPFDRIEQEIIAAVLSDMDAEIAALEQRRDKTLAVKQGMMQQLLTGKIRLAESVQTTTRQASTASTGKGHNLQINEAVVISVLAGRFGNEEFPLSRMRYTKLSYLLHRHVEGRAEGYLKKAAGPYNPRTRYGGPETIALKNHYVRRHGNGGYRGFIAGENVEKAQGYFSKWYGEDCLKWLDQFRYERSGDLELLTTVDLAAEELREAGKIISVESVKEAIRGDPEWQAKLNRVVFSDANISRAIDQCRTLFDPGRERPKP